MFEWRSRYWTFLLKLDPKRPASTIQGQPGPYVGPFHWQNRRLRVPELKRLQGFPDEFELAGSRRSAQLQVGNSVPPPLGAAVATAVREQLEGKRPTRGQMRLDLYVSAQLACSVGIAGIYSGALNVDPPKGLAALVVNRPTRPTPHRGGWRCAEGLTLSGHMGKIANLARNLWNS